MLPPVARAIPVASPEPATPLVVEALLASPEKPPSPEPPEEAMPVPTPWPEPPEGPLPAVEPEVPVAV